MLIKVGQHLSEKQGEAKKEQIAYQLYIDLKKHNMYGILCHLN